MKIALLTGGKDAHYARGLVHQLAARGVDVALVGSREMATPAAIATGRVKVHDLVGDQDPSAPLLEKVWRVLRYYSRLAVFIAHSDARLFHLLWFRKFPKLERVLLNVYLKLLGKKVLFTAHNVDDQARDGNTRTFRDRLSLRFLYCIVDHIFVHTSHMRRELIEHFGVAGQRITVVPFGINDVIPISRATRALARQQLGLNLDDRILLFFGNLAPYKGVEDLIRALAYLVREEARFRLVLAGRPKDRSCEPYCRHIERLIEELGLSPYVRQEIRYIPDDEASLLFRASDVSILPYRRVYQSGVLALSYAQGLPVIVADILSMRDDVIDGETGLVFRRGDPLDLADTIRTYFASHLFADLEARAQKIRAYGAERFSWAQNAEETRRVYGRIQQG